MSSYNDGFFPAWDQSGDVFTEDWLPEYSSVEDVTDGAVWRHIHFFEFELLDSVLVGSYGGAFDPYFGFFYGLPGLDGDLIIGGISIGD